VFTFRLAERLHRTVAELEAQMSNREFLDWVALAHHDEIERRREESRAKARG
jgi:hypothetical protein